MRRLTIPILILLVVTLAAWWLADRWEPRTGEDTHPVERQFTPSEPPPLALITAADREDASPRLTGKRAPPVRRSSMRRSA